jgi:hypothetical protein
MLALKALLVAFFAVGLARSDSVVEYNGYDGNIIYE